MTGLTQAGLDAAAGGALEVSTFWCGHRGRYQVHAILCGRGGRSDRLMSCGECGAEYLASFLATVRPPSAEETQRPRIPLGTAHIDVLAHERAGEAEKERHMSVPTSRTGNPQAHRKAQGKENSKEDLGPGSIAGNLCADPELRYTPSGRAVARLRVAWTPRIKDEKSGKWEDGETEFFGVDVWGAQAENCAESLAKGDRVVADGQWSQRTYENKEGENITVRELTARDIGPSLLFRTATIKRTQRSGGSK